MASQLIPMAPAQPAPTPPAAAPVARGGPGARRTETKAGPSDFDHLVASLAHEDDGGAAGSQTGSAPAPATGATGRAPGRELSDPAPSPDASDDPAWATPPPMAHVVVDRLTVCELPATVPVAIPDPELALSLDQGQVEGVVDGDGGNTDRQTVSARIPVASRPAPTLVAEESSAVEERVEPASVRAQAKGVSLRDGQSRPQEVRALEAPTSDEIEVSRGATTFESGGGRLPAVVKGMRETAGRRADVADEDRSSQAAAAPTGPVADTAILDEAGREVPAATTPDAPREMSTTTPAPEGRPGIQDRSALRREAPADASRSVTSVARGEAPPEEEPAKAPATRGAAPATPKHHEHLDQLTQQLRGLEPTRAEQPSASAAPANPVTPAAGQVELGTDTAAGGDSPSESRPEPKARATAAIRSFRTIEAAFVPASVDGPTITSSATAAVSIPQPAPDTMIGAGARSAPAATVGPAATAVIAPPAEPFVLSTLAENAPETLNVPEVPLDLGPFEGEPHEQVVKAVRLQWQQGVSEARLTLRPEHLGEVTVTLKIDNGVVAATLKADTAAAAEWIRSHQADLRSSLDGQGLSLESLEVGVDPEGRRRQPARERERDDVPRPRRRPETEFPRFDIHV